MNQTGKLMPAESVKAQELLDALMNLHKHGSFMVLVNRIGERLGEIDRANRRKNQENIHTEGEAWEWFLGCVDEAKERGVARTMPV